MEFKIIFTFSSSTILNLNPRTVIPFSCVRASWTVSSWMFRWTKCNSSGYLDYWKLDKLLTKRIIKSWKVSVSEIYERKHMFAILDSINTVLRPMVVLIVNITPKIKKNYFSIQLSFEIFNSESNIWDIYQWK